MSGWWRRRLRVQMEEFSFGVGMSDVIYIGLSQGSTLLSLLLYEVMDVVRGSNPERE